MKLFKRHGIWYVTYQIPTSSGEKKQIRQSLETKDKANADLIASKLLLELQERYKPPVVQPREIRFLEFKTEYLHFRESTVARGTRETDKYALQSFYQHLGQNIFMRQITQQSVDNYKIFLKEKSTTTVKIYWKHLSMALNKAVEWGYADYNYFKRQVNALTAKSDLKEQPYLTVEQIRLLIDSITDVRFKTLIMIYLHTGARRSEALSLVWNDIDFTAELITLKGQKDYADRTLSMSDNLKNMLLEFKEISKEEKLFDYSPISVSQKFKRLRGEIGLPNWVTIKNLRTTFASHLAVSGLDLRRLSEILGHSDIRITIKRFACLSPENIIKVGKFIPY